MGAAAKLCVKNEPKVISSKPPHDLDDLSQRVEAAKAKNTPPVKDNADGTMLGMAWRLSTELIVAVLVGWALGYGLDYLFGTKPWMTIIGLGFGIATGIRNTFRTAAKMDEMNAHIPLGEDLEDVDDEDDEN